ncbi:hypothetical protein Hanom_Chr17g01552801 [Helianthus anomalus]
MEHWMDTSIRRKLELVSNWTHLARNAIWAIKSRRQLFIPAFSQTFLTIWLYFQENIITFLK